MAHITFLPLTLRELRALHDSVGKTISDYEGTSSLDEKQLKDLRGLQKSLALRINEHPSTSKKDRV